MKPKKATPKPAEPKPPTAEDRHALLTKTLTETYTVNRQLRHDYNELKQDYLELAEQVGSAFTTSKRIIARHTIGRRSVIVQGIEKQQF